jgi:hypothetical protein
MSLDRRSQIVFPVSSLLLIESHLNPVSSSSLSIKQKFHPLIIISLNDGVLIYPVEMLKQLSLLQPILDHLILLPLVQVVHLDSICRFYVFRVHFSSSSRVVIQVYMLLVILVKQIWSDIYFNSVPMLISKPMYVYKYVANFEITLSLFFKLMFTPLHSAAQQGHVMIVKLLLEHGASPNKTNKVINQNIFFFLKLKFLSSSME